MKTTHSWQMLEPDVDSILRQEPRPLDALAAGAVPAIVLRSAFSASHCWSLVQRLIDKELIYDPHKPVPEKFREAAIPEGYYREGQNTVAKFAWQSASSTGRTRIDVGTSLGYRGSNREEFFAHSRETHVLFQQLFEGNDDPVRLLYDRLQQLSRDKRVVTAHEPDGQQYGPAIIRAHYGGYTYKPHFDSVRLREKRPDYAVYDFQHQFAGVLVLQNTQLDDRTAQCVIHRCLWQPEIDVHLTEDTFHKYADEKEIEKVEVVLEPGDLYFFNTRCIHEVPGVAGTLPRIVLATFIGYSAERDDIFVWS